MSWAACADHNVNLMPVVFTSMLGMTLEGMTIDQAMSHLFGEPCYVFTQTPQVWLDHQVMESDGELMFSWYCMDNVLEPGAAEAMFNDYCAILQAVIAAPESLKTLASGIARHIPRRRWPLNAQADYDLRHPAGQSGNNRTGRVDAGYRDGRRSFAISGDA